MARFGNIRAALASKGAAALGASVLMVGGGVAVAQSGVGLDTAEENLPEEVGVELDTARDHVPEEVGVGLDTARDHVPDQVDLDELFPFAADDDDGNGVIDAEQELEAPEVVELEVEQNGENGEGERSETADRVHRALTGADEDDQEPIGPGDEGFGEAVSERAQEEGPLGADVSSAARGDDEDTEGEDERPGASGTTPGPPEEVPGPPTNPGPNG